MKTQASIMPGIYKRARYSRKEGAKMIQDIAPKKYDNHYEEQNPADEDWMLVYKDGQILCRFDQEKIYFPKVKETGWKGKDVTYL